MNSNKIKSKLYLRYFALSISCLSIVFLQAEISISFSILDAFITIILWLAAITFFIIGTYKLINSTREFKLKSIVIPLLIVVSIILFTYIYSFIKDQKILFNAYYNGDLNGITITLNNDDTYQIDDIGTFQTNILSGKFRINFDTLILEDPNPLGADRPLFKNKFLITAKDLYMITEDQDNKELFVFTITKNELNINQ